jgi:hypothetical protein
VSGFDTVTERMKKTRQALPGAGLWIIIINELIHLSLKTLLTVTLKRSRTVLFYTSLFMFPVVVEKNDL